MPYGSYRHGSSGRSENALIGQIAQHAVSAPSSAFGFGVHKTPAAFICAVIVSAGMSACTPISQHPSSIDQSSAGTRAAGKSSSRSHTRYQISAAGWEKFRLSELENDDVPTPVLVGAFRPAEPEAPVHIRYPEVPLIDHPDVAQYVSYYTKTKRRTIEQALDRRAKVVETVRPIFERRGLPSALIELALLESTFNTDAKSSCGSTIGMWQLSAPTAREHGLRVDARIDERRDLVRSSEAAASLLEDLFEEFNDWYLAVAAYNSGKGRVHRAMEAGNTRDPFQLAARGLLSETTRQFVARFAALAIVMDGLEHYDFIEPPGHPDRQLMLAEKGGDPRNDRDADGVVSAANVIGSENAAPKKPPREVVQRSSAPARSLAKSQIASSGTKDKRGELKTGAKAAKSAKEKRPQALAAASTAVRPRPASMRSGGKSLRAAREWQQDGSIRPASASTSRMSPGSVDGVRKTSISELAAK